MLQTRRGRNKFGREIKQIMPYNQQRENFFKLFTLVHLHGTNINRHLLEMALKSMTFEDFINYHQHEIYHFFTNSQCCQCKKNPVSKMPSTCILKKPQMLIIFDKNNSIRLDKHEHQKQGLCCLKAKKDVKLTDLDLTFIRFFLVNFCFEVFWDCHLSYVEKTFSDFLNESVHKVYHLSVSKISCCKCSPENDIPVKRINTSQFEILYKKEGRPCQAYCSCVYKINSGITLSFLLDKDKDLTTELTRYFCQCHKYLEDLTTIRNSIAHASSECSVNDDIFLQLWDKTADRIIGIAKALDLHKDYDAKLNELRNECSNSYCQTCLVDLIKKTEHVAPEILQKIDDSTEGKEAQFDVIMAYIKDFHIDTCTENEGSNFVASFADDLKQFAIAVRKKIAPVSISENPVEMEIQFSLDIRDTSTQKHRKRSQDSEDDLSEKDEQPDRLICGKCNVTFTHLEKFCVHKENCCKREKKKTEQDPSKKITFLMKMTGADNSWTADVMKIFRGELNCFNTDNIDLRLLESSCLIIWAETSQSDLECEKQLKDNCINFTKNMFNKCPLQSNEAVNINVTVKCSELFQESANDDADHLECGKCGQVCFTINSFITHKTECLRNRKRRRGNKQDESKGDLLSAQKNKKGRAVRILKEEENFLRIAALMRFAIAAVRVVFENQFHGDALERSFDEDRNLLVSLARQGILSQSDFKQIYHRPGPIYYFSLKLMIWLIEYRTPSDVFHGLHDDQKHISIYAGLTRILNYKNKISRMMVPKLGEDTLEEYWTDISEAIVRLGGDEFLQKCNNLRLSIFNNNYIEMLTEIIEIAKSNDSNPQGFTSILDNLEFHPDFLQRELRKQTAELKRLKGRGLINPAQWAKLFTRKDAIKSETFDLSLMICLIQNLTPILVTDQLPGQHDITEVADLSRLEYYRKQITYSQECALSDLVFKKYWTDITDAIGRIGGTMILQRCQDLKMGKLDQEYTAILPEATRATL
ncbi:Hypothetical predicted protein [Mytilus galloprovincialis]|uniref:DZIP3-like HEPN domain-containing protein n=1 Tax=Mytilus galloprovincialis TaxID=29158 RepID=A0A8B6F742_MYTGA|nr:Hypothetical predicted protein [Mytilus galloprovincialis]